MKTTIIALIVLSALNHSCFAQELSLHITKEQIDSPESAIPQRKFNAQFRVKIDRSSGIFPDLIIPTATYGPRTRLVDARLSNFRVEVATQDDEFGIDYSDFRLVDGKWILEKQKGICSLNGVLARALAQVDISEGPVVEVKFSNGFLHGEGSWEDQLINKVYKHDENVQKLRYDLQGDDFVLVGKPFDPSLLFKDPAPSDTRDAGKSPVEEGFGGSEAEARKPSNTPTPVIPAGPLPLKENARGANLKSPATVPTTNISGEQPAASTPWGFLVVGIVAVGALLWLLLKRRS